MEGTTSTLLIQVKSDIEVGDDSDVAHIQAEENDTLSSIITGRNSVGAVTRNADNLGFQNDDTDRSVTWDTQGTFRFLWTPTINGNASAQRAVALMRVDNGGVSSLLELQYTGVAFIAGWLGGVDITHSHLVVAGQEYKIVLTWIGPNGELGESQGTLIFDLYDPVAASWAQTKATATQASADATTRFWLGSLSGSSPQGWGYFSEVDIQPFVMPTEERRAFP